MKPFLMGTETEYGVSGQHAGSVVHAERVFDLLNAGLRRDRLWLPDVIGRDAIYLENGSRFYLDYDSHPEYATPECFTPRQVAAYDKAGERLLENARAQAEREHPGLRIRTIKNNLDPIAPEENSYGCHESYTCWVPLAEAARALIPHLVSRIVYAGSGCLSARDGAMGFELSQRARHIVCPISEDTMDARPIFCTRVRKTSDGAGGWTRAHLVGKDSQRSPFGIYLTFATTGMLFQMLNEGYLVGAGLELKDPVQALQDISRDPTLTVRVPLADGHMLTALEIQECYLAECERAALRGSTTGWTLEALRHWRETLEALARNPLELADRLDPYCKLLLFEHELRKARSTWRELHDAMQTVRALRSTYPEAVLRAVLHGVAPHGTRVADEERACYDAALLLVAARGCGLEQLRFAVRMQALDLTYHELGGLYDRLAALGQVKSVVLEDRDVERATRSAPPGGRAALRSSAIRCRRGPDWVCDWEYLFHQPSNTCVDMRDPFGSVEHVVTLPQPPGDLRRRTTVLERLNEMAG